jgi:PAS domain-containing protein
VSGLDDFDRVPDAKQVREALEEVSVPSFAVDRDGVIRWVNKAAIELVGDPRGRLYTSVVPAHLVPRARERFASIVVGGRARDLDSELMAADGSRLHIGSARCRCETARWSSGSSGRRSSCRVAARRRRSRRRTSRRGSSRSCACSPTG